MFYVGLCLALLGGCSRYPDQKALSTPLSNFSSQLWLSDAKRTNRPIAIDPGHGGRDYGAKCLHRHLLEKKLNLETAIALRTILAKRQFSTMLSRRRDEFVALDERARRANRKKAVVLVSIHHNWAMNKQAHGIEIFYPSDTLKGPRANLSRALAQCILEKLQQRGFSTTRGVKPAGFRVLQVAHMPAVLVECGFLSNLRDLKQLSAPKRRHAAADAIAEGVQAFLAQQGLSAKETTRAPTAVERTQALRRSTRSLRR